MCISAIIAAVGVAASIAGTAVSYRASQQQVKAQKQLVAAQQSAENSRQQQMNLDATRKKREIIRQAQVARAAAVSTANAQGAGDTSALAGAEGAISGQSGVNYLGVAQNQQIGNDIFSANASAGAARMKEADAGGLSGLGSGLGSLGGALVKNSGTIARIGGWS